MALMAPPAAILSQDGRSKCELAHAGIGGRLVRRWATGRTISHGASRLFPKASRRHPWLRAFAVDLLDTRMPVAVVMKNCAPSLIAQLFINNVRILAKPL